MSHERIPSFFAIIPATVRYCKELEPSAKLLYGELTALTQKEGYCWASNKYLCELYDVNERTLRRWLSALEKNGFIKRDVDCSGSSHPRKIWISNAFTEKNDGRTKTAGGADENVLHINTSINTEEKEIHKENAPSDASAFCSLFHKKIKDKKPDFSKKISPSWIKNAEKLLKLRKTEELEKIIDFALEDSFWCANVLSPEKLLKHLDALEVKMGKKDGVNNTLNCEKSNQELKEKVKERYSYMPDIVFGETYIEFNRGGAAPSVYVKTSEANFREQVINNLRKMGLFIGGL